MKNWITLLALFLLWIGAFPPTGFSQGLLSLEQNGSDLPLKLKERWEQLSPEDRIRAQRNFEVWKSLAPEERKKFRNKLERFRNLPPERQEHIRKGFKHFQNLPEERKKILRERFKQWETLSPQEKQGMRKRLERFQKLPPEERERVRERFFEQRQRGLQDQHSPLDRDYLRPLDKRRQQEMQRRHDLRRHMRDLKNMERLQHQSEPLRRAHPRRFQ